MPHVSFARGPLYPYWSQPVPQITELPPANVRTDLQSLANDLDGVIPQKRADNILVATWNIRAFGSLTREWTAVSGSHSPTRDLRGLRAITDIVSRFDVVAIQEVVGNLRALRDMMRFLGDDWSFLMTDVTLGDLGNNERLAYVFDRTRVRPSGLAAELVVPPDVQNVISPDAFQRQFARTPYAVSFRAGDQTFILTTLHVLFGDEANRVQELQNIAAWLATWATRTSRFGQNLITLGDFNIDRQGDALWDAFTSTGLTVPAELEAVPRTIFADPNTPTLESFYDQIAWFETGSQRRRLTLGVMDAGSFDFLPHVYTDTTLSRLSISFRVSDHYPLWVEFGR